MVNYAKIKDFDVPTLNSSSNCCLYFILSNFYVICTFLFGFHTVQNTYKLVHNKRRRNILYSETNIT